MLTPNAQALFGANCTSAMSDDQIRKLLPSHFTSYGFTPEKPADGLALVRAQQAFIKNEFDRTRGGHPIGWTPPTAALAA